MHRMSMPKPRGEIGCAVVLLALVAFFLLLATLNIFAGDALISSSIWILLIIGLVALGCKDEGVRKLSVDFLGAFAVEHFVERGA